MTTAAVNNGIAHQIGVDRNGLPVTYDYSELNNGSVLFVGKSGVGKTTEIMRQINGTFDGQRTYHVMAYNKEYTYTDFVQARAASRLSMDDIVTFRFGHHSGSASINPLIFYANSSKSGGLFQAILGTMNIIKLWNPSLGEKQRSYCETLLIELYERKGFHMDDPSTWNRPAGQFPTLLDLDRLIGQVLAALRGGCTLPVIDEMVQAVRRGREVTARVAAENGIAVPDESIVDLWPSDLVHQKSQTFQNFDASLQARIRSESDVFYSDWDPESLSRLQDMIRSMVTSRLFTEVAVRTRPGKVNVYDLSSISDPRVLSVMTHVVLRILYNFATFETVQNPALLNPSEPRTVAVVDGGRYARAAAKSDTSPGNEIAGGGRKFGISAMYGVHSTKQLSNDIVDNSAVRYVFRVLPSAYKDVEKLFHLTPEHLKLLVPRSNCFIQKHQKSTLTTLPPVTNTAPVDAETIMRIGVTDRGEVISVDWGKLDNGNIVMCGTSGCGKSWTIRRTMDLLSAAPRTFHVIGYHPDYDWPEFVKSGATQNLSDSDVITHRFFHGEGSSSVNLLEFSAVEEGCGGLYEAITSVVDVIKLWYPTLGVKQRDYLTRILEEVYRGFGMEMHDPASWQVMQWPSLDDLLEKVNELIEDMTATTRAPLARKIRKLIASSRKELAHFAHMNSVTVESLDMDALTEKTQKLYDDCRDLFNQALKEQMIGISAKKAYYENWDINALKSIRDILVQMCRSQLFTGNPIEMLDGKVNVYDISNLREPRMLNVMTQVLMRSVYMRVSQKASQAGKRNPTIPTDFLVADEGRYVKQATEGPDSPGNIIAESGRLVGLGMILGIQSPEQFPPSMADNVSISFIFKMEPRAHNEATRVFAVGKSELQHCEPRKNAIVQYGSEKKLVNLFQ